MSVLFDTRTFIKKWRTKGSMKPKCFCAAFDEKWRTFEKCDRTKKSVGV